MKMTIDRLRFIVSEAVNVAVNEAKKKGKKKAKKSKPGDDVTDVPPGYKHSKVLDYAQPLGKKSFIKAAGAANFGPYTNESLLRKIVADVIREQFAIVKNRGRR